MSDTIAKLRELLLSQSRAGRLRGLLDSIYGAASTGAEAYGAANSPMAPEHAAGLLGTIADLTPVVGDVKSAYEGVQAAREGDWTGAGLGMLGALPFVPGITAWHGSPHKFDKFDMSKIGTGEGAQAYGHGLYLAENPKVAQEYSKLNPAGSVAPNRIFQGVELVPGTPEYHAGTLLERSTLPAARKEVAGWIAAGSPDANALEGWKKTLETLNKATKKSDFKVGKNENLYKTDIPDEAVARFLDWDKPLSQQNEIYKKVKQLVADGGDFYKMTKSRLDSIPPEQMTGRELYQSFVSDRKYSGQPETSADLRYLGIPGIRYLDGGSRGAGNGTSNFVLFDDKLPRILERNGQPTGLLPWSKGEWKPK